MESHRWYAPVLIYDSAAPCEDTSFGWAGVVDIHHDQDQVFSTRTAIDSRYQVLHCKAQYTSYCLVFGPLVSENFFREKIKLNGETCWMDGTGGTIR